MGKLKDRGFLLVFISICLFLYSTFAFACQEAIQNGRYTEIIQSLKKMVPLKGHSARDEQELRSLLTLLNEVRNLSEDDLIAKIRKNVKSEKNKHEKIFQEKMEILLQNQSDLKAEIEKTELNLIQLETELNRSSNQTRSCTRGCQISFWKSSSQENQSTETLKMKVEDLRNVLASLKFKLNSITNDLIQIENTHQKNLKEFQASSNLEIAKHKNCKFVNFRWLVNAIHLSKQREIALNNSNYDLNNEVDFQNSPLQLRGLSRRLSKIEQDVQSTYQTINQISKVTHLERTKQIYSLSVHFPKAHRYFEEVNKHFYLIIQTYWHLQSGKIATATTKTELAARVVGTGIKVIPGSEPIASAIEASIIALKSWERKKRFKNAYETFSNTKVLENVSEILALQLAEKFKDDLNKLDLEAIFEKATIDSSIAYHAVTSGKVLKGLSFNPLRPTDLEIAEFLVKCVLKKQSPTSKTKDN